MKRGLRSEIGKAKLEKPSWSQDAGRVPRSLRPGLRPGTQTPRSAARRAKRRRERKNRAAPVGVTAGCQAQKYSIGGFSRRKPTKPWVSKDLPALDHWYSSFAGSSSLTLLLCSPTFLPACKQANDLTLFLHVSSRLQEFRAGTRKLLRRSRWSRSCKRSATMAKVMC